MYLLTCQLITLQEKKCIKQHTHCTNKITHNILLNKGVYTQGQLGLVLIEMGVVFLGKLSPSFKENLPLAGAVLENRIGGR